jgi:hypothetical protein
MRGVFAMHHVGEFLSRHRELTRRCFLKLGVTGPAMPATARDRSGASRNGRVSIDR